MPVISSDEAAPLPAATDGVAWAGHGSREIIGVEKVEVEDGANTLMASEGAVVELCDRPPHRLLQY